MAGVHLQPATVVQAVGRMVRPQFRDYIPTGQGFTGQVEKEAHAAKYLILLERKANVQEDFVEIVDEIDHPQFDEDDEDEDDEGEWEQPPGDNDALMQQDGEEEWEAVPENLVDVNEDEARALLGHD